MSGNIFFLYRFLLRRQQEVCVYCELTVSAPQPTQTPEERAICCAVDRWKRKRSFRGHLWACTSVNVCVLNTRLWWKESIPAGIVGVSTIKPVYEQTTARSKKIESIHLLAPYLILCLSQFYSVNIVLSHTWFGLKEWIYIRMADENWK